MTTALDHFARHRQRGAELLDELAGVVEALGNEADRARSDQLRAVAGRAREGRFVVSQKDESKRPPGCIVRETDTLMKRHITVLRKGQAKWPTICRRITSDLDTGELISDEDPRGMQNDELYRALDKPRRLASSFTKPRAWIARVRHLLQGRPPRAARYTL